MTARIRSESYPEYNEAKGYLAALEDLEQWKPIWKWPFYEVSNKGNIRSWKHRYGLRKNPIILKSFPNPKGYMFVKLCDGQNEKTISVASLVVQAFIGVRPSSEMQIDHIDNDKKNNTIKNLRYMTGKENVLRGNCPPALNARKTHCPRGHEYITENLCAWYLPKRKCRICHNARTSRRKRHVS